MRWFSDARRLFAPALAGAAEGAVQVAYLDGDRRVIELVDSPGDVDKAELPIQDILRRAVQLGASGLMIAHSHGSRDPAPQPEDIKVTRRLIAIGRDLDVEVYDHLIFAGTRWISFRRLGLM